MWGRYTAEHWPQQIAPSSCSWQMWKLSFCTWSSHCQLSSVHVSGGFFLYCHRYQTDVHLYLNLHRSCQVWVLSVICCWRVVMILSITVIFLLFILHHATLTTPNQLWYWNGKGWLKIRNAGFIQLLFIWGFRRKPTLQSEPTMNWCM